MMYLTRQPQALLKRKSLKAIAALSAFIYLAPYATPAVCSDLYLAYPHKDKVKINSPASFLIGNAGPGATLKVNNDSIRLNQNGFFAHVIKLNRGNNKFVLTRTTSGQSPESAERLVEITRPTIAPAISAKEWKLNVLSPSVPMGLSEGDLLILKARGTPGANVSVILKNRVINLSPANVVKQARSKKRKSSPQASVNWGQAVAYGKVFQNLPYRASDLYVGFYRLQAGDNFANRVTPVFVMKKSGKTLKVKAPGDVTLVRQPILAQTTVRDAVVRVAPDKARLTPIEKGVRLFVDGWQGDNYRCLYGKNKHVWIKSKEIAFERGAPGVSGPPPVSSVRTVNLSRSIYGDAIVIPLQQRLPYDISQSLNPNKITLRLYGAVADTDWVSQQYREAFEGTEGNGTKTQAAKNNLASGPRPAGFEIGLVESVDWKQVNDDLYELTVHLRGKRQWGYTASYQNNNLLLHVKDPPLLTGKGENLTGLKICVDPGHGGAQPGATGCSGVTEATVNLAIAKSLKKLLEAEGATVIMTRMDDRDLGLYERVDVARAHNADILLSVHNNSLPDGRDPWKEHGTSTYFYNKQAQELARVLNTALVAELGFPNIGARYQNLALTRPTQMLSVLAEIGFMINPDEYAQLLKPEVQEKAARAMVNGLKGYFKNSGK